MSKINVNFIPMSLPKYDGLVSFNAMEDQQFPVYATPTMKGVPIMVRHGRVHFNGIAEQFRNLSVKEKFHELFRFTFKSGISVHATLSSKSVQNDELVKLLCSYDARTRAEVEETAKILEVLPHANYGRTTAVQYLPDDLELVVTDVVIEDAYENMAIESRKAMLDFINREVKSEGLSAVVPTMCFGKSELDALVEHFAEKHGHMDGVAMFQPGSTYWQGSRAKGQTSGLCIDLSDEEMCNIVQHELDDCVSTDAHLEGRFAVITEGGSSFEIAANLMTAAARRDVNEIRDTLVGKVIVINTLQLPNRSIPTCRSIKGIGLPSTFQRVIDGRFAAREKYLVAA